MIRDSTHNYRDCKTLMARGHHTKVPRQIVQAIATLLAEAVPVIHTRMVANEGQQEADTLVKGLLRQIGTLTNHCLYPLVDVAHQAEHRNVEADHSASSQTPLDEHLTAHGAMDVFRAVFRIVGTMSQAFAPGANHMVSIQMKGL